MGLFLWLFRFAYLRTTEKAINSNLNNLHAQNYVYGLPADKFMGTSGTRTLTQKPHRYPAGTGRGHASQTHAE